MQPNFSVHSPDAVFSLVFILIILFFALASIVLTIVIWWKILSKAGFPGALGLLALVPLVNLICLIIFAFAEWPIQKELKAYRAMTSQTPSPPGYTPPPYGGAPRY